MFKTREKIDSIVTNWIIYLIGHNEFSSLHKEKKKKKEREKKRRKLVAISSLVPQRLLRLRDR